MPASSDPAAHAASLGDVVSGRQSDPVTLSGEFSFLKMTSGPSDEDSVIRPTPRPIVIWAGLMSPGIAFVALVSIGPFAGIAWVRPTFAFGAIVAVTALCVAGATAVLALGWRARLAEVAILGAALTILSFLSLVHGLTIPGVLFGENAAVMSSVFAAVPLALIAGFPLVVPGWGVSRAVAARWRPWTLSMLALSGALGAALLIEPDLLGAPTPGSPGVVAVAAASLAGALALSLRQLRLFRIGARPASLAASTGFLYLGLSTLVWLGASPFSIAWWAAHAADGAGVLAACAGLAMAHHRDRSLVPTLAPVVNRDPLVALELGLTPVVHRFMAALNQKDRVTRDHVVRVGELAMRVGVRAGLEPENLRALGLGALLHDIGKLDAPIEILQKPGALTDEEFDRMKAHTIWGADLLRGVPLLAPAADLVRWHHERADGGGYPDGLGASRIPLEATIISVCDAWDAMTFSRPYRQGMAPEAALDILHSGAGSQWSPGAVDLLTRELRANGPVEVSVYERVGRDVVVDREADHDCAFCLDAVPPPLRGQVAAARPEVAVA